MWTGSETIPGLSRSAPQKTSTGGGSTADENRPDRFSETCQVCLSYPSSSPAAWPGLTSYHPPGPMNATASTPRRPVASTRHAQRAGLASYDSTGVGGADLGQRPGRRLFKEGQRHPALPVGRPGAKGADPRHPPVQVDVGQAAGQVARDKGRQPKGRLARRGADQRGPAHPGPPQRRQRPVLGHRRLFFGRRRGGPRRFTIDHGHLIRVYTWLVRVTALQSSQ